MHYAEIFVLLILLDNNVQQSFRDRNMQLPHRPHTKVPSFKSWIQRFSPVHLYRQYWDRTSPLSKTPPIWVTTILFHLPSFPRSLLFLLSLILALSPLSSLRGSLLLTLAPSRSLLLPPSLPLACRRSAHHSTWQISFKSRTLPIMTELGKCSNVQIPTLPSITELGMYSNHEPFPSSLITELG